MAALRRGDRSIPPDPWDDITFGDDVMAPWRFVWRRVDDDPAETIAILRRKFGVTAERAESMVRYAIQWRRRWFT